MNLVIILLLGVVEGLTEFLPISSTFHLLWTSYFLGLNQLAIVKLAEVVIQSGAILAVGYLYGQEVLTHPKLIFKVSAAFIPTGILGLLLHKIVTGVLFDSYSSMLVIFILVGLIFWGFEVLVQKEHISLASDLSELTYLQAALAGVAQALAMMPGVSRAGAVLIAMMLMGFKRREAAKFSFLLAVPTILSAGALDLYQTRELLTISVLGWLILGCMVSFLSALLALKWLNRYLETHDLKIFAWYRLVLGLILTLVYLFR